MGNNSERLPVGSLFAELHKRWGMFPNQTTLGSYDYFSQSVRLHAVRPDHLEALNGQAFGALTTAQGLKKFVPVSQHEYAHWVDMNCTLYGLRITKELALSYHFNPDLYREASNAEPHFYHAKKVFDSIKQIRLPNYYSVNFDIEARRPWKYQISVGHGFDTAGRPNSDPIVFLRFASETEKQIARQPLSLASILEANATYNEMLAVITANSMIVDSDERMIEEKGDHQSIIDQVYDPKLTLYSVSAHLCASAGHIDNIASAYKAAAILSRFVLNIPKSCYSNFKAKRAFAAQVGSEFSKRIERSVRRGNVESLFFYAATVLDWERTDLSDPESDLANLSQICFGIDFEELRRKIDAEAKRITAEIYATRFPDAELLATASLENCAMVIRSKNAGYSFGSLHLPPCFLSNDEEMIVTAPNDRNKLAKLAITDRFYSLYDNESWIRKFSEACYPRQELFG